MDLSVWGVPIAFLWTALVIELTPGPNMTYLAILSLAEGRRAGFAAVAGVATGLLIVGMLAAFGLAALLFGSPASYAVLRWAGMLYLFWLAYGIWTNRDGEAASINDGAGSLVTYYRRGLITNLLNPKAAIFYVAVLPPFIDPARSVVPQTVVMTTAYVAIATLVHTLVVALASKARPLLENAVTMRTLRRTMALSVTVVALWLVWTTRMPIVR